MAYATVADVQARVPTTRLAIGAGTEPSTDQVQSWLDAQSAWLDAALSGRYATPITDAGSLPPLRDLCAALVAARVWTILDGAATQPTGLGADLRREALQLLAYNPASGACEIVLPGATPAAGADAASGSFADPEDSPYLFTGGMSL